MKVLLALAKMIVPTIWCASLASVPAQLLVRGPDIVPVRYSFGALIPAFTNEYEGASCSSGDDCSDDLVCKSGKCASP